MPDATVSKVKIVREFNKLEYQKAAKSLDLLSFLFPDLVFTNSPPLFWMESKEFDGLTILGKHKFILISSDLQFNGESVVDYFKLAAILGHEQSHCERGLNEKEVRELVDNRIILFYSGQNWTNLFNWKP